MRPYSRMRHCRPLLFLVSIAFGLASIASGDVLKVEAIPVAAGFGEILSRLETLAEAAHPDSAVRARIYRVSDEGECDGSPKSCPKSRIFVAISEYDENPASRVFELPKFHNWEFVRWVKLPTPGAPDASISFILRAAVPAKDPDRGWWEPFEVEVIASPYAAPTIKNP